MDEERNGYMLITDIGSTTTKALLLRMEGGGRCIAEADVATTVERPEEDVKIGVRRAIALLEQRSGVRLLAGDQRPVVPYLSTSSAGGGLQIMVFGLAASDTGRAAELTAHGAGGVILRTFTIDDGTPAITKMRLIRELHPDMVLMAGGMDGGNIASLVRLAEILNLAKPTPKFAGAERIPLVFCGNKDARDFVINVLDQFDLHIVDNIRPSATNYHLAPAKAKIHDLFMENVMERAPGYQELKNWVSAPLLPTPAGVDRILSLYAKADSTNLVMVDMGGATTDIFSIISGACRRTVAANIGMSYSIANIAAQAGMARIMAHLQGLGETMVHDYLANKMLSPTELPVTDADRWIEQAAAVEGIDLAWSQHREMNFRIARLGFLEKLRLRHVIDPFLETFSGADSNGYFQESDIDLVIGSGGVLSHAGTAAQVIRMLVDGFRPCGVTRLAVDQSFKSPHLGVLSTVDEKTALRLYTDSCLRDLAWVVAPSGRMEPNRVAMVIEDETGGSYSIKGGEVHYLETGGNLRIKPAAGVYIRRNNAPVELRTDLPVLIDCRGRGNHYKGKPLGACGIGAFRMAAETTPTLIRPRVPEPERGMWTIRRELP
ncbi:glutamate mutase L, partial [bacterium]|nr:glutamate mutase L [candidate division CSSED10-310 bacterium]